MEELAQKIQDILGKTVENIESFIETANVIVELSGCSVYYSTSTIEQITIWLTAHLASVNDPPLIAEKIGDASESYANVLGSGLFSSRFGAMLKLLDPKGCIEALGKRRQKFRVLG